MKKLLLITTLFVLAGCNPDTYVKYYTGQITTVDIAMDECKKIGYVEGTTEFKECVQIQTMSIRSRR